MILAKLLDEVVDRLQDRVERILVIFEWPQGASDVCLYVSAPGQTIDPATLYFVKE